MSVDQVTLYNCRISPCDSKITYILSRKVTTSDREIGMPELTFSKPFS